jgi:TRAP-type C4-dicarboxylate transport system permease small subunit
MVAMILACCILTLSVALRYFFKMPTDWQDELAVFMLVGSTFLTGAYVQSQRGHVGIEALASILPASVNRVRVIFCDIASFAFCAFFSWKSWTLLHEAVIEGQRTQSPWASPLWIPYGLMATGMTLLSLQILLQMLTGLTPKEKSK